MIQLLIRRFTESYFRHRWLYLLPFALIAVAACVAFILTKPTYVSEGVLFIQKESLLSSLNSIGNSNPYTWTTPAQTISAEINEMLQTESFIRAVIQNTDLEAKMNQGPEKVNQTIADTRKELWVTTLGDNQITIHASYETPTVAAQLANGVIESYIKWQSNSKVAESEAALAFFGNLITVYQSDLEVARQAMKSYLEAHPQPIRGDIPGLEALEIKRLQADLDLATTRYSSALDKEENARLALSQIDSNARQTYIILDAPRPSLKPEFSLKDLALKYGLFILVGALLSVLSIIGGIFMDRTFHFNVDVTNALSLPVLAIIPYAHDLKDNEETETEEAPQLLQSVMGMSTELVPNVSTEEQVVKNVNQKRGRKKVGSIHI
jgi:uncharacterized protein involved in exopolysaccharide biosynthesis